MSRRMNEQGISRRRVLQTVAATLPAGACDWSAPLRLQAEELKRRGMACILLWMQGGPSQFETFDPKPGHANGGETKAIDTAVPGIQIASSWSNVAKAMHDISIVRSMTNREGNHQRATYQLHTGYSPSGSVKHPSFGSVTAAELGDPKFDLPPIGSIPPGPPLPAAIEALPSH